MPVDLQANPSGYVVRMENDTGVDMRLELVNPWKIQVAEYLSWSVDVMLSSESTSPFFLLGPDFHTSFPEQGGSSWYSNITAQYYNNNVSIACRYKNVNTDEYWRQTLIWPGSFDRWYNLRMDFVTPSKDASLGQNQLRLEFYVNGRKMAEVIPTDSELLLDPSRLAFGPARSFQQNNEGDGTAIGFVDNVKAVYRRA